MLHVMDWCKLWDVKTVNELLMNQTYFDSSDDVVASWRRFRNLYEVYNYSMVFNLQAA